MMRKYPNLYADISAGSGYGALTRDEKFAYKFMDEFQDRLFFGQDYCAIEYNMPHIEWLRKSLENKQISREVFDKITYKNVSNLLDLNE